MGSLDSLAHSLGGAKKTPEGYLCRCPCHDDKTSSLSIAGVGDNVVFNCFAGCKWEDIQKEVMRRGLISKPQFESSKPQGIITYNYSDADGNLVFQKVRGIRDGKKAFYNRQHLDGKWVNNLQGITEKPLYKLPDILKAIKNNEPIAILEGEKDCDNFQKLLGIPATTNFDGASANNQKPKWTENYSKSLSGADVFIFYDNDAPGIAHRDMVIKSITPYAKSITIGHLPSVFNNQVINDFSDWVNAGGTKEDFSSVKFEVIKEGPKSIEVLDLKDWLTSPVKPQDAILCDVFDRGDKVVIIGQSKTRKSFFTLQLALCLAAGESFVGFVPLKKQKVLLIQSEIKKDRYHQRVSHMVERLNLDLNDDVLLLIANTRGLPSQQLAIEALAVEHKPDVIIIDPFYKVITGDESKSEDVKPILAFFDSLAERLNATVIYVHHDKKGISGDQQLTDRGSGTGILARDFDSAVFLSPHRDLENELVVEFVTRNYAPLAPRCVEWANYCFISSSSLPLKRTSRTLAKGPKTSVADAIGLVYAKLKGLGKESMPVGVLNSMLDELNIPVRTQRAVKEELIEAGVLELEWTRGTRAKSLKVFKIDLSKICAPSASEDLF